MSELSAFSNQLSAEHPPGLCRVCGCQESLPCVVAGEPCGWVDQSRTLCSNCAEMGVLVAQWGATLSVDREPPQFQKLAELAAWIYDQATAATVEVVELATPEGVQAIITGGRIQ